MYKSYQINLPVAFVGQQTIFSSFEAAVQVNKGGQFCLPSAWIVHSIGVPDKTSVKGVPISQGLLYNAFSRP